MAGQQNGDQECRWKAQVSQNLSPSLEPAECHSLLTWNLRGIPFLQVMARDNYRRRGTSMSTGTSSIALIRLTTMTCDSTIAMLFPL